MRVHFKFSNLYGTVYKYGNVQFMVDGNTLMSPVGNKVTLYDLKTNRSRTLPIEAPLDIVQVAVCPSGLTALLVTQIGEALYVSLVSGTVLHRHSFGRPTPSVVFSPDGRHVSACRDGDVHIYAAPGVDCNQYNPFMMRQVYHLSPDQLHCAGWSMDSRLLAVGGEDSITRIVCGDRQYANLYALTLGGHTAPLRGVFFARTEKYHIITVDRRGVFVFWTANIGPNELVEGQFTKEVLHENSGVVPLRYTKTNRTLLIEGVEKLSEGVEVTASAYHGKTQLLATGFQHGALLIHDVNGADGVPALVHSVSVGDDQPLRSVTFNGTGDWLALATGLGQLIVWEWASETYVMRQQSHSQPPTTAAFSPDAQLIASGGDDGKVKVWDCRSGFCVVTFTDHTSAVTDVCWTQGGKAVLSASLDGTVRACDLLRYRNFRTLVCDRPAQLSCVAVDAAGEIVVAGARDLFDIFVWSLQNGRLLDVLTGHESPISRVCIDAATGTLASCSWDGTVRLWNVLDTAGGGGSTAATEVLRVQTDVLDAAFSPDGIMLAVLTLDSRVHLFEWKQAVHVREIDARMDLVSGRSKHDVVTAETSGKSKSFTTLCFSPEGDTIILGGQTPRLCLFSVKHGVLINSFTITLNRSLDAASANLDWRRLRLIGTAGDVSGSSDEEDSSARRDEKRLHKKRLPGAAQGTDKSARRTRPEVRVQRVDFSPMGTAFTAATSEGVLVYALTSSLDNDMLFDPFQLSTDVTPASAKQALIEADYGSALQQALMLNDDHLIYNAVHLPPDRKQIGVLCESMTLPYAARLLDWLARSMERRTTNFHLYLLYVHHLLQRHGSAMKQRQDYLPTLTACQHALTHKHEQMARICDQNKYMLDYVLSNGIKQ